MTQVAESLHPHADFIDRLGGPTHVARRVDASSHNVVANWRTRGVPWHMRTRLVALAVAEGIAVPAGFTTQEGRRP